MTTLPPPNAPSIDDAAFVAQRKHALRAVFLTIFLDLVGFGMFIPIVANVAREMGASTTQAAALSTWFSVGTLFSVVVLGRISDRVGRRPVLLATVVVSAFAQLATGFVGSVVALSAVRFVAGLAAGNISVAQACIADLTSPRERSRFMILIGVAFGAGFAVGPGLGALLASLFPNDTLRAVAFGAFGLNLLNVAAVAWRLSETKGARAPAGDVRPSLGWRVDLTGLLRTPGFAVVLVVQFLQVFSFVGVETILPIALRDAYALGDRAIYAAFVFLGVCVLAVNGGLARRVLRRRGEVRTLGLGQIALSLGIAALPLFAPDGRLLYAALALLALGTGLSNPALSSITSRLAPANVQGFALGAAQTLGAAARILGPVTLGGLYDLLGGARSLYASFALLCAGAVLVAVGLRGAASRFATEDAGPERGPPSD